MIFATLATRVDATLIFAARFFRAAFIISRHSRQMLFAIERYDATLPPLCRRRRFSLRCCRRRYCLIR